ncbi:flagellar filament capping protein FliD [Ferriphaselus sp. R-1]|uniref:flagellar filament capping protein FliD n=1 Tax=Ferriphaselus sp. R-1 TaxID=1485544 RepID=UPI00055237DD|nr:flagellar filament capping protein FliD [Ferriphaselus sp. R-1]
MATTSSITSGGMIDVNGLVTSLMGVERRPVTLLTSKQTSYQAKLSAMGSIKSAVSTFQATMGAMANASSLQTTTATSGDSSVFSATASSTSTIGSYSIEVSKIAQAQKLATAGLASTTTAIGNGTLTFDFGTISGGTFDSVTGKYTGASFTNSGASSGSVTIDASNNSLQGIRDAINSAKLGVTASIVNDGSGTPYRLALSSSSMGSSNSIKISVTGDAALSSLLSHDPAGTQSLAETATAQNAQIKVDGISISKSSNTITDAIAGVTLTLKKPGTSPVALDVASDTSTVTKSVQGFVDAYNTLNKSLSTALASGVIGSTAPLHGDSLIRSLQSQIRSILSAPLSNNGSTVNTLSQIGVGFQSDGSLALNSTKLSAALSTNAKDVTNIFAASGSATDSLVSFASGSTSTKPGSYAVSVTQLATQGKLTGSVAAGTTITAGVNDTVDLTINGIASTIKLGAGSYTAAQLAAEVQGKINGTSALSSAGVSVGVTESGGVLSITSGTYGSTSSIAVTGGNGATSLLGGGPTAVAGLNVEGSIDGTSIVGSGRTLTSSTGNSNGLSVTVSGGALGARGTVSYSRGYAYQLNQIATDALASNGSLTSRTDGLTSSVRDLGKQIDSMNARMTVIEARLRKQYSSLDAMLSRMSTTSTYLSQQLSKL